MQAVNVPPKLEEVIPRLRGVLHAYAFWFAAVAAAALVAIAPTDRARLAAAIYGGALCALFAASGLYHRWRWHPRWKPLLRRLDHSTRSEEHTSELQSHSDLVCRLLLEKK